MNESQQRKRKHGTALLLLLLTPATAYLRSNPDETKRRLQKPTYWWPTRNKQGELYCVKSNTYPDVFLENYIFLFDSEDDCCSERKGIGSCAENTSSSTTEATPAVTFTQATATQAITTTEAATSYQTSTTKYGERISSSATKTPDADCPEMKWHISVISGGANTCTNDLIYPSEWKSGNTQHLFVTAKECCDRFFPTNCKIVDHCGCSQNWHISVTPGDRNTCTNDEDYPAGWLHIAHEYFFTTPQECCQVNCELWQRGLQCQKHLSKMH